MNKRIPLYAVIIIALICITVTFQVTYLSLWGSFFSKRSASAAATDSADYERIKAKLDQINELYESGYVRDIDPEKLESGIMAGYIYGAGDRFGEYMDKDTYEEYLDSFDGETVGVGIMVIEDTPTGLMQVVEIIPGSPAEAAGLQIGDLIVTIGDVDAAEAGYYKSLDLMRGEEGTTAEFTVYRDGEYVEFSIVRTKVVSVSVMHHMYSDGKTGIVRITSFEEPTPVQFREAMEDLKAQGAERYVFDLRSNGGGLLDSVTDILDYLLPEGTIIRITDRDGNEETMSSDPAEIDAPMAVLVNGDTASAAELFTAALRDYDKSVTVGTRTYGKGSMQTIIPLEDGSAVRISLHMYSPPKSDNYDGVGIEPDVECELDPELAKVSLYNIKDEDDNQLAAAIAELNKK